MDTMQDLECGAGAAVSRETKQEPTAMSDAENWRPIAGVPRDRLPGTLLVWIVGGCEHSGVSWRREGMAIVTLNNNGPFGFDSDGLRAARNRLDMQWIDAIDLYRPLPRPPYAEAEAIAPKPET